MPTQARLHHRIFRTVILSPFRIYHFLSFSSISPPTTARHLQMFDIYVNFSVCIIFQCDSPTLPIISQLTSPAFQRVSRHASHRPSTHPMQLLRNLPVTHAEVHCRHTTPHYMASLAILSLSPFFSSRTCPAFAFCMITDPILVDPSCYRYFCLFHYCACMPLLCRHLPHVCFPRHPCETIAAIFHHCIDFSLRVPSAVRLSFFSFCSVIPVRRI